MSPSAPLVSNSTTALTEESPVKQGPDSKLVKGLKPVHLETPVEVYGSRNEVPSEFLITDPKKFPGRNWGDDDVSAPVSMPVVDISALTTMGVDGKPVNPEAAKRVVAEMGKACTTWGIMQVINHGIPEPLLDRVLEVASEFAQLPVEEKQSYALRAGEIEGYGRLDFNLRGPGPGRTRVWHDALRHILRPTRIIEEDRIPNKPEAYRPVMEEYISEVERILDAVWTSLSRYVGLEPASLREAQGPRDEEIFMIRLNFYPTCPEPEKVLGQGPHKDFGSITVLLNDEVGGLQVQKPGSTDNPWVDVKPRKGALLINIAHQVEILSNGKYPAVLHRVMVNKKSKRISVAVNSTPGPKCVIAPIPELLEKSNEAPLYTKVLYGDYPTNFAKDAKAGISPSARYEINRN